MTKYLLAVARTVLLLVLGALPLRAATIVAASCSSANAQTAINSAVSNDTVALPGPCSATWNTVVTVPSTKGITLDGRSATITCGTPCSQNNSPILRVVAHASVSTRVTALTLTSTGGSDGLEVFMEVSTGSSGTDAKFRIDHVTFNGDRIGFHLQITGAGYGLIDHCTFLWDGNNEVIQHEAYGFGSTTGWGLDVVPGSPDALYVEDSVFTNKASSFLGGKVAAFYGAKTVYRFNTFTRVVIDNHGTPGNIGARWWELYRNTFVLTASDNVSDWIQSRAGSGMIFSNSSPSIGSGGKALRLWEEDGGYPALYQVGRGKNQTLSPAYIWLKDADMPLTINEASANQIVANRDYYIEGGSFNGTSGVGTGPIASRPTACTAGVAYWATDEGEWWAANAGPDGRLYKCTASNTWTLYYTPYVYPHPLQGSGAAPVAPVPPSGLQVGP